jgi:hypothetical protein
MSIAKSGQLEKEVDGFDGVMAWLDFPIDFKERV